MKKRTLAIYALSFAIPENPNIAATIATMRNMSDQCNNIHSPLYVLIISIVSSSK